MSKRSRRRQRESGERKRADQSKYDAMANGIPTAPNDNPPWRAPLRKIMSRKRVELKKAGYG